MYYSMRCRWWPCNDLSTECGLAETSSQNVFSVIPWIVSSPTCWDITDQYKAFHVIMTKKNKMSLCRFIPTASWLAFDEYTRAEKMSRRIQSLAVPPFLLPLLLFISPLCWILFGSPVVKRVPLLSGCLHFLSHNWSSAHFSSVTALSFLHSFPSSASTTQHSTV